MSESIQDKIAQAVLTIPERALAEAERIRMEPVGDRVSVTFDPLIVVLRSEGWDG